MLNKVIVVEDVPVLREQLGFYIEEDLDNTKVFMSANGHDAIQIIEQEGLDTIDFILTDMRMPLFSGIELLKCIREDLKSNIPVVVMTGYDDLSRDEVLSLGASDFIYKPFDPDSLVALLEYHRVKFKRSYSKTN